MDFVAKGVIPAGLMAWNADFSINGQEFRSHLRDIAAVAGVTAICVNGHASEVTSCSEEEQERVLEMAVDEVGNKLPLISGVYTDSSLAAAKHAKHWEKLGASALLVFPPSVFGKGAQQRPEMVIEHFSRIADATGLPLIVFQYPLGGGQGYSMDTLLRLADSIPSICAIKDYSGDPVLHEQTIRLLQNGPRKISMLTSHSSWLLPSLSLGCEGILSGAGSTIAALQVELFNAVKELDLIKAREVNERMNQITRHFYRPPFIDQHNRMKEAQVMLGKMSRAVVRPPLMKLTDQEVEKIRGGLIAAGLLSKVAQQ